MIQAKRLYLNSPPIGVAEKIEQLFASVGIEADWADSPDAAAIGIFWPADRMECDEGRLFSGGFMTCPTAFKATARLEVDRATFGKLLNLLDIKLKQCQFGCF
jgi:hypothetical protein